MGRILDIIKASKVVDAQVDAEHAALKYAISAQFWAKHKKTKMAKKMLNKSLLCSNKAKNLKSLAGRKLKKLKRK